MLLTWPDDLVKRFTKWRFFVSDDTKQSATTDGPTSDAPHARTIGQGGRFDMVHGFAKGGDFLSSIIAGMLLGLGADYLLGTRPVFVVLGIVAGSVTGFYKLWLASANLRQAPERFRGR